MKNRQKMILILENETIASVVSSYLNTNFDILPIENNMVFVSAEKIQNGLNIAGLKPKEVIILESLKKGKSYNEIADIMGFSINGVRYYIKSIYTKLGVTNSRAAINNYLAHV